MASSLVSKVNVASKAFLGQAVTSAETVATTSARSFKVVARTTQQKAAGTAKKAFGTAKQAVGTAKKAVGTVRKQAPLAKVSAPIKKAAPAVKKAAPAAARTVKRAARKATGNASDDELSKWYGPNRRLFLPEGLLDREEVPSYLTGEIPGDYGYDPLGLGKKEKDFDQYRAAELIHARWAMLGAAGIVIPEAFNRSGLPCGPEAVWWKTGAQLLEGESLQWCGITIPLNLAAATIAEIVLVGGAEYYRSANKSPLGSDLDPLHPGGAFDPLGLADDPDQFALLKVKEIKNGRLALFSLLGFFVQAYVTQDGPVANLAAHLDDPFANNIISVIGGNIERSPVL
ncbi:light harvesting chlorophyll a b-binding protein [Klebsormidium nitens]|uniref:Chlorophyll a-b binding protein, chloroplastic n=1 Tax=Klebsormidium nitens TaxID=105231 RepID=A0A1Y1HWS0_KLENI|nr:light harvesting chlorophyll a b-binding protein [Klebsormidium nitens]|eukprot:GAQ82232.1 light harvesting chlorophyll a b-binding protein [Klebsormidium nitens]